MPETGASQRRAKQRKGILSFEKRSDGFHRRARARTCASDQGFKPTLKPPVCKAVRGRTCPTNSWHQFSYARYFTFQYARRTRLTLWVSAASTSGNSDAGDGASGASDPSNRTPGRSVSTSGNRKLARRRQMGQRYSTRARLMMPKPEWVETWV